MDKTTRRSFLKLIGNGTVALSMGLSIPSAGAKTNSTAGKMKAVETDVAVIGGGCAGMAAAATAAQMGMKVSIFEKQESLAAGGMGPFAVESRMQRERQLNFSVQDAFEFYMKHTHYRADAKLISAYLSKSANTIDWFVNMGITFTDLIAYYPGAQATWHFRDPKGPTLTDTLATKAKSKGTVIYFQTPAKELIKQKGRVVGLIAENKSGEALRVTAKAVIIGTGGFSDNLEMIKKYTTIKDHPFLGQKNDPMLNGDGIRMAWEAGAGQSEMWMDSYRSMPGRYNGGPGGMPTELGILRQPIHMVNQLGERFVNEEVVFNGAFSGNAVDAQKGRCAYGIFDEETNRYYEENDWDWIMPQMGYRSENVGAFIKKAMDEGYEHLFMTDSIEELCSRTGINLEGLQKTLDEYNRTCDSGRDTLFFKKAKFLKPVRKPKFYAARFCLAMYGGLGGIKINHKTEALTKNFDVLPGLYCAGNDVNSICGGSYPFYLCGHTSGFAYNTGRIAGENAVRYIKHG